MKDEIELHKKLRIDTLHRFNVNKYYSIWLSEYYKIFKKPVPKKEKEFIKKSKVLFINDEHLLFRIMVNDFIDKKYDCPKCNHVGGFVPTRHKKLDKMLKIQKFIRCESPRTLSCVKCSFTFNPMSIMFYSNTKIDLRKWFFYLCISKDGEIDYPIPSIGRILNVSYGTAKSIKLGYKTGERRAKDYAPKYINSKDDNHALLNVFAQYADHRFLK